MTTTQDSDPRASGEHPEHGDYPDNPILVRSWRGGAVESAHRGAWCLVDSSGAVLDGAGSFEAPFYARSSIKCLQALPLLETGAAEHFGFSEAELALAMASHNGEPAHTDVVRAMLARLGLGVDALRCGPQVPGDPETRRRLQDDEPLGTPLHNNCSGKHAGFLALALQLGVDPARYLEPDSEGQRKVRSVLVHMAGVDEADLVPALDGCSAPTYRMPLRGLATAFARFTNPDGLAPARRAHCLRLAEAVRLNPGLIAGEHRRVDTDIVRATDGRLFPKIGAEAVYAIGVRGGDCGLALKIDDGGARGLHALLMALLERLGLADAAELERLATWRDTTTKNRAGLDDGHLETTIHA